MRQSTEFVKTTEQARLARVSALEIGRAFAPMNDLLDVAQRLAVNAALICAKSGERAKALAALSSDLTSMVVKLRELVEQVQDHQTVVVRQVSTWMIAEQDLSYYQKALEKDNTQTGVARAVERAQRTTADAVAEISFAARRLELILERTRWVGTKHSRYIAVLAAIEARRFDSVEMQGVATDMRSLSIELAVLEERASNQVRGALDQLSRVQRSQRAAA